ncbi:hypothetical protein Y032_0023g767 [Ancylostoma ceylanicum]|uniref:Receptor L-domain domain-containing protein n=1 Tax=Ancylostoma ceylanicum TaxID=53326 RepID=A0A016UYL2_9BILA|nr:hypothetical protein Y032_0023g767 [Ancylostoma ceylanicum]
MNGALLSNNPEARIENNPILDPNCTHLYLYYSTGRRIRRNKLNCGCELDGPVTNASIHEIDDDCDLILGHLIINGANSPPSEILVRKFAKATRLTGELSIFDTHYTDLSFLKNVRSIEVFDDTPGISGVSVERFLRIEENNALERLSWHNLQYLTSATIRITGNPNLCYTTREVGALLSAWKIDVFGGNICEDAQSEEVRDRACRIGTTANLSLVPNDCQTLVGHLIVNDQSRTEELWKLYNVTTIYGSLTIRNSSLRSVSPLWQLSEIFSFAENQSALVIEQNANLKYAFISGMRRMMSDLPAHVAKNPILSIPEGDCASFNATTGGRISFQGNKDNCEGITTESSGFTAEHSLILALLIAFC